MKQSPDYFLASLKTVVCSLLLLSILASCRRTGNENKEEQVSVDPSGDVTGADTSFNSMQGVSLGNIATTPTSVILTGLPGHRLVTVYRSYDQNIKGREKMVSSYSYEYNGTENEYVEHFMPGIDILYGYNLLNIAHYDLKTGQLNFLFKGPALVKTLYYPSFVQDSLNNQPINRNYYLVSAYDEDTNKDTLINRKDLRRFYYFDETSTVKTQLIPADYSVIRSQYDKQNDIMYLFAKHDADKNGTADNSEPMHIFWIDLKAPARAKRLY